MRGDLEMRGLDKGGRQQLKLPSRRWQTRARVASSLLLVNEADTFSDLGGFKGERLQQRQ